MTSMTAGDDAHCLTHTHTLPHIAVRCVASLDSCFQFPRLTFDGLYIHLVSDTAVMWVIVVIMSQFSLQ